MQVITIMDIDTFSDLKYYCWSGAIDRLNEIEENDLEDEFMEYLEEQFDLNDTEYTMTNLNDFIWFECDKWIEEHKKSNED